jgi:cell division septum initiation protein DivIVA
MPRKSGSNNPAELIKMAIDSIDSQIKELTQQREQLAKMVPGAATAAAPRRGRPPAVAAPPSAKPKRQFSEATRKKLRAAAKARWARIRAERGE